jgi:hypothetical protein
MADDVLANTSVARWGAVREASADCDRLVKVGTEQVDTNVKPQADPQANCNPEPPAEKEPEAPGSSASQLEDRSMSDQAEGAVADAGHTIQSGLNQAGEAKDQLTQLIRERPISAVLLALGIGYLLGKII